MEACNVFDRISPVEMLHKGIVGDIESVRRKGTFKAQLSHVGYHCRVLEGAGCLEVVDEQPVRGASVEHFYSATAEAYFSDEEWASLSYEERTKISKTMWRGFVARGESAQMEGTFDGRTDRWLLWDFQDLDEQGWRELTLSAATFRAEAERIREDSETRISETGAETMQATYGIFAFESPRYAVTPDDK